MKIDIRHYGVATYMKMLGHNLQVELTDGGLCHFVYDMSEDEYQKIKDEFYNSQFYKFDKCARELRNDRNRVCCPKY